VDNKRLKHDAHEVRNNEFGDDYLIESGGRKNKFVRYSAKKFL